MDDLRVAIQKGDVIGVKNILKLSVFNLPSNLVNKPWRIQHSVRTECTPLLMATEMGNPSIIYELLCHGAYVNDPDANGMRPIHHVCYGGHVQALKVLLDNPNCDVCVASNEGTTPLHSACTGRYHGLDLLTQLVIAGADVHAKDADGSTPLHYACMQGYPDVITYLLDCGSDVNAKDIDGHTPLHIVSSSSSSSSSSSATNIACMLLARGADVHARNRMGWSPLHKSLSEGNKPLSLELVYNHGASMATHTNFGLQAVQVCIRTLGLDTAKQLHEAEVAYGLWQRRRHFLVFLAQHGLTLETMPGMRSPRERLSYSANASSMVEVEVTGNGGEDTHAHAHVDVDVHVHVHVETSGSGMCATSSHSCEVRSSSLSSMGSLFLGFESDVEDEDEEEEGHDNLLTGASPRVANPHQTAAATQHPMHILPPVGTALESTDTETHPEDHALAPSTLSSSLSLSCATSVETSSWASSSMSSMTCAMDLFASSMHTTGTVDRSSDGEDVVQMGYGAKLKDHGREKKGDNAPAHGLMALPSPLYVLITKFL